MNTLHRFNILPLSRFLFLDQSHRSKKYNDITGRNSKREIMTINKFKNKEILTSQFFKKSPTFNNITDKRTISGSIPSRPDKNNKLFYTFLFSIFLLASVKGLRKFI